MSPTSKGRGRGSKAKYTGKQKRQAEHIEKGYRKRGTPKRVAERRAWAAVNKIYGGGERSGSGRGKPVNRSVYSQAGRKGGRSRAAHS